MNPSIFKLLSRPVQSLLCGRFVERGGENFIRAITFIASWDPSPSRRLMLTVAIIGLRDYLPALLAPVLRVHTSQLA